MIGNLIMNWGAANNFCDVLFLTFLVFLISVESCCCEENTVVLLKDKNNNNILMVTLFIFNCLFDPYNFY